MKKEMVEDNLRQLEKKIREIGFPEEVLAEMREKVRAQKNEAIFVLYETKLNDKPVRGEFQLWREAPMKPYELINYSMELEPENKRLLPYNIFQSGTGYDTTLREAFNLMQGRFVWRELASGPGGQFWVSLDMNERRLGVGTLNNRYAAFRAEEMIAESGLAPWLKPQEKAELAEALKRGDLILLPVEVKGMARDYWVQVDAKAQHLLVRDKATLEIYREVTKDPEQQQEEIGRDRSMGRRR